MFLHRFVEYWARIGSEDNMTMCHRPTCRKEGVLLDYSTDGGGLTTCLKYHIVVFPFFDFIFSVLLLILLILFPQECHGHCCTKWII